jgi:PAS domain S-box-containing protein
VGAFGLVVLLSWQLDIVDLRTFLPGSPQTVPLTAIFLILLGIALALARNAQRQASGSVSSLLCRSIAVVTVGLAFWVGIQHLFKLGPNVEMLLYPQKIFGDGRAFPGRPSPQTAFSCMLAGTSIGLSTLTGVRARQTAIVIALSGLIIPWLAIFDYAAVMNPFTSVHAAPRAGISLIAASSLVLLALGVVALWPHEGPLGLITAPSAGGQVVRRLLPVSVLVPVLYGWLVISARLSGLIDASATYAASWGISTLFFSALVMWGGHILHNREAARANATEERERMYHELERATLTFQGILEAAPDAIVIVDESGNILLVNAQAEKCFGFLRDEIVGQRVEILLPPRLQERHVEHRELYTSNPHVRSMGQGMELLAIRKDGTEFPAEISLSPIETPQGKVVMAAIRDITERKQTEKQLRTLNEMLRASNKELEAFSYSVSHDLRAPVRHIDGFTDLLRRHAQGVLDEKSTRYVDIISDSAKQMGVLIDDLLKFSRMGRVEMLSSTVDLQQLTTEVIEGMQTELKGRMIEWKISELPEIRGDPAMLRLVLENLISNAVKYTRKRIRAEIEIRWTTQNDQDVFCIRDNGAGFNMEYADKLFTVFQRLHRSDEFEGTGIGLANVRRIISRHGGKTWAEGEVDKGASFYFSLPRRQNEITT